MPTQVTHLDTELPSCTNMCLVTTWRTVFSTWSSPCNMLSCLKVQRGDTQKNISMAHASSTRAARTACVQPQQHEGEATCRRDSASA